VERFGIQVPIALDMRVVAATNRDPDLAMAEGRLEWRLIREALLRIDDDKSAAARLLENRERSLWYKPKQYGG
jgi:transcriptional regulator with PAS, ATPase and Fis domain